MWKLFLAKNWTDQSLLNIEQDLTLKQPLRIHGNSPDSQINKLFIKIQIVRINLHQSQHQSINFQTFMESATERPSDYEAVITVWCHSHVILRYFHLTTFFWMFLEGTIDCCNEFLRRFMSQAQRRKGPGGSVVGVICKEVTLSVLHCVDQ